MTMRQEEEFVLCDKCGYYVDGDDPAYACTCQCREAELLLAKLDKEDLKKRMTELTSLANDLNYEVTRAKTEVITELDILIRELKLCRKSAADDIQIGNIYGLVVGASGAKVDAANARLITATLMNQMVSNVIDD